MNHIPNPSSTKGCPVIPLGLSPEYTFLTMNFLILVSVVIWIGWEFSKSSSCGSCQHQSSCLNICVSSGNLQETRVPFQHFAQKSLQRNILVHCLHAFYTTVGDNQAKFSPTTQQGSLFLQFPITYSSFPSELSLEATLMSLFLPKVYLKQSRPFLLCASKFFWPLTINHFQNHFHIIIVTFPPLGIKTCISVLCLLQQITTNLVDKNNINLCSHSS